MSRPKKGYILLTCCSSTITQVMKLSKQAVAHVARLARLGLTDEEAKQYAEQLSSILDYVEQLKRVDTEGIEPTAQVTGLENILRDDVVAGVSPEVKAALLKQAPALEKNLVKTKSVFDEVSE